MRVANMVKETDALGPYPVQERQRRDINTARGNAPGGRREEVEG